MLSFVMLAASNNPTEKTDGDMAFIAQQEGVPCEEAERLWGWHGEFATLLDSIIADNAGNYSSAEFGDGRAVVSFAGAVPSSVRASLNEFSATNHVPITVQGHAGFTDQQFEQAVWVTGGVLRDLPGVKSAFTWGSAGSITAEVALEPAAFASHDVALRELVSKTEEAISSFPGVTVTVAIRDRAVGVAPDPFTPHNQSVDSTGGRR